MPLSKLWTKNFLGNGWNVLVSGAWDSCRGRRQDIKCLPRSHESRQIGIGGQGISHAFIIHAGVDKARLAPVLHRLNIGGVRPWIDDANHEALELDKAAVARLGGRIKGGSSWRRQRNLAMLDAYAVVFVISETSVSGLRAQVEAELSVAELFEDCGEKPVFAIALSPEALDYSVEQIGFRECSRAFVKMVGTRYRLTPRGEREVDDLIEELLAAQRQSRPLSWRRLSSETPAEMASPYFANREPQKEDIRRAIGDWEQGSSAIMPLPVLFGTWHDCPNQFALTQVRKRLLPAIYRTGPWERITLHLSRYSHWQPDSAVSGLVRELRDRESFPRAAVVYAMASPEQVATPRALETTLHLWCQLWSVFREDSGAKLLPILDIRSDLVSVQRSWITRLRIVRENSVSLQRLKSAVAVLNDRHQAIELRPTSPFGMVSWHCVEQWLADEVQGVLREPDRIRVEGSFRRLFEARSTMTMAQWAEKAVDVLEPNARI